MEENGKFKKYKIEFEEVEFWQCEQIENYEFYYLQYEKEYLNDKLNGKFKLYNRENKLIKEEQYINGVIVNQEQQEVIEHQKEGESEKQQEVIEKHQEGEEQQEIKQHEQQQRREGQKCEDMAKAWTMGCLTTSQFSITLLEEGYKQEGEEQQQEEQREEVVQNKEEGLLQENLFQKEIAQQQEQQQPQYDEQKNFELGLGDINNQNIYYNEIVNNAISQINYTNYINESIPVSTPNIIDNNNFANTSSNNIQSQMIFQNADEVNEYFQSIGTNAYNQVVSSTSVQNNYNYGNNINTNTNDEDLNKYFQPDAYTQNGKIDLASFGLEANTTVQGVTSAEEINKYFQNVDNIGNNNILNQYGINNQNIGNANYFEYNVTNNTQNYSYYY